MKKILFIVLVMLFAGLIYAGVTVKTEKQGVRVVRRQHKYELGPGDIVIVIRAGYTSRRLTVKPSTYKIFEYKVPAGKTYNGDLIEH